MTMKPQSPTTESLRTSSIEDDDEDIGLLGLEKTNRTRLHATSCRQRATVWGIHAAFIILYGIISVIIINHYTKKLQHGASLVYSPARQVVDFVAIDYDDPPPHELKYFREPDAKLDRAWDDLLIASSMHITASEMNHFPLNDYPVQLPGGTYFAQLMVYHQLHCLKRIYQSFYPEYYHPNISEKDARLNRLHNAHCLDSIRQDIMCHGDISVVTMRWINETRIPVGDFSSKHECVDWGRLHEWATERAFTTGFEPGVLVHPVLGPSFPKGHSESIGLVETGHTHGQEQNHH